MARGKQSALAANRLARADNAVVAGLRAELATVAGERDALRAELDLLRRDVAVEARRVGGEIASDEVTRLAGELVAAREEYRDRITAIARELRALGDAEELSMTMDAWVKVADLLGLQVGDLIDRGNRHARRTRRNKVHKMQDAGLL